MGAFSPTPIFTEVLKKDTMEKIFKPIVRAMAKEGRRYRGILYAGLINTPNGLKVLEFNVRFGDPETQPILMRMESDIVPLFFDTMTGMLKNKKIKWKNEAAVCVVMASEGYPANYPKGEEISGLDRLELNTQTVVFHAGTKKVNNKLVTSGGRVLGVSSVGDSMGNAIKNSYEVVSKISWKSSYYRTDIGKKAVTPRILKSLSD
jgi:phosphoribosylamine--glycine ligase